MKGRIKRLERYKEEEANGTSEEIKEKFYQNVWILVPH